MIRFTRGCRDRGWQVLGSGDLNGHSGTYPGWDFAEPELGAIEPVPKLTRKSACKQKMTKKMAISYLKFAQALS